MKKLLFILPLILCTGCLVAPTPTIDFEALDIDAIQSSPWFAVSPSRHLIDRWADRLQSANKDDVFVMGRWGERRTLFNVHSVNYIELRCYFHTRPSRADILHFMRSRIEAKEYADGPADHPVYQLPEVDDELRAFLKEDEQWKKNP